MSVVLIAWRAAAQPNRWQMLEWRVNAAAAGAAALPVQLCNVGTLMTRI